MRIVCISDTHGFHEALQLPKGDLIIHAGDISKRGTYEQIHSFLNWFSKLDFKYKVFIAGNHDFYLERAPMHEIKELIPSNVIYLNDSGTEIEGLKIWGSPIQPWFNDWAFNRQRGEDIQKHWDKIPENTDILIAHGPAYGILDRTTRNERVGCMDLLRKIEKIQPELFVSGHIHEAYGEKWIQGTHFINCSVLDFHYRLVNPPIVVEL